MKKVPADPKISTSELVGFGFNKDFATGITCARDLFEKLRETRNAISHFLIDTNAGESLVYLADGAQLRHYSMSGAAMLHLQSSGIGGLAAVLYEKRDSLLEQRRHDFAPSAKSRSVRHPSYGLRPSVMRMSSVF